MSRVIQQSGNTADIQSATLTVEKMQYGSWMTQISKESEPSRKLKHQMLHKKKMSQPASNEESQNANEQQERRTQITNEDKNELSSDSDVN